MNTKTYISQTIYELDVRPNNDLDQNTSSLLHEWHATA